MIPAEPQNRSGEAGFSLVEGLIAAVILLFVILGVLPLMSQSMKNNLLGNDASNQTNASVDGLERRLSVPFNSADMVVPPGSTSLVAQDVFTLDSNRWIDKATFDLAPAGDTAQYTRTAVVEQFGAIDFDDGNKTFVTALDGDALTGAVHFKRVTMTIQNERLFVFGTASGAYEVVTVQTY